RSRIGRREIDLAPGSARLQVAAQAGRGPRPQARRRRLEDDHLLFRMPARPAERGLGTENEKAGRQGVGCQTVRRPDRQAAEVRRRLAGAGIEEVAVALPGEGEAMLAVA